MTGTSEGGPVTTGGESSATASAEAPSVTSVEVRERLVEVLARDLVGLDSPEEVLSTAPSRWYLTGFLVPHEARPEIRQDPEPEEGLASGAEIDADEPATPEAASARKAFFPSSIGLSVLVPGATRALTVKASWGEYRREEGSVRPAPEGEEASPQRPQEQWRRAPKEGQATAPLEVPEAKTGARADGSKAGGSKRVYPLAEGISAVVSVRRAPAGIGIEAGALAVSVFLVNERDLEDGVPKDQVFLFQASLELTTPEGYRGFLPRPNIRGRDKRDPDEQIAELQYRDVFEYAVGHGAAAEVTLSPGKACTRARTTWLPTAEVEKVVPGEVEGVTLGMEALADAGSAAEVRAMLTELPAAYKRWIEEQHKTPVEAHQGEVLSGLLHDAETVARRIADGLKALDEEPVLFAFQLANRVMARAARARGAGTSGSRKISPPAWRPFQLAFLLMNLQAMWSPVHHDRAVIDLLFFPTGGGKTEAYLGLAAFSLVLRRLRSPGVAGAGVSVIMRYTLRLLTLDQLGRASALVCALELERQERAQKGETRLGSWPFEIGLWVGKGATPNRMGAEKNFDPSTARMKVKAYKQDATRNPSPVPLEACPWCGHGFSPSSFRLSPSEARPQNLEIYCVNRDCAFSGERALPILTVDEPIYRRLPCFLIATVDKFAQLPWVGQTGALFGKVSRQDEAGFYGPCDPGIGRPITPEGAELGPPDLVIQDELHLISGPLGTMVGLYETAIDVLCERRLGDKSVGPKIIASTATVRRAEAQIKAIFGRSSVTIFPPPGPDRRDSFFAKTVSVTEKNGRRYLGVAAPGRSLKVALLRVNLALLAAGQKAYDEVGAPADPYTTLVGYFNSLRELGGSRRIVEDEVTSQVRGYDARLRVGQTSSDFAKRSLGEPVELTSREPTHRVARAKDRLGCAMGAKDHVDVALATNMISVGLDISRLGLMVVLGQPKTTAEYIQATSRVGRDDARPGLVVTLLNVHKPRDRSHYERFGAYHASFYRAVEATSVTPFSPRALDRGMAAVTVALGRLSIGELTPARGAEAVGKAGVQGQVRALPERLRRRAAEAHADAGEAPAVGVKVEKLTSDLLDSWKRAVEKNQAVSAGLQYQREEPVAPALLRDPLEEAPSDRDLAKFKAQRSLRDVEPSVDVYLRKPGARRAEGG